MRKGIEFIVLLFIITSTASASISIEEEWTLTEEVYDWDISSTDNRIAFINDAGYYIYNADGDILLQGKNIWNSPEIEVCSDKFLVSSIFEDHYYDDYYIWHPYFNVYTYSGQIIRTSLGSTGKDYFVLGGNYILSECGDSIYLFTNSEGQYQSVGTVYSHRLFNPYGSEDSIDQIIISMDNKFIATRADGIIENRDGHLEQVLDYEDNSSWWLLSDAAFINGSSYILVELEDEILVDNEYTHTVTSRMYDQDMNLIWEKGSFYGQLYGYADGFISTQDNMIYFYNIDGEIIQQKEFSDKINKIFIFNNKEFILVQIENQLIQMDLSGRITGEIELKPPYIFTADGRKVFTYRYLDDYQESEYINYSIAPVTHPIEITCYRLLEY